MCLVCIQNYLALNGYKHWTWTKVHNEIWGILFTVEQKKEQKEVPGPRGSLQFQTQQLSQLLLLTTIGGGACCWLCFSGVGMLSCQALPVGHGLSPQSCHLALLVRTPWACRVRLHPWGHAGTWTWARYRQATWHVCVHKQFGQPGILKADTMLLVKMKYFPTSSPYKFKKNYHSVCCS